MNKKRQPTLAEQFKENAYDAIKFIVNNESKLEHRENLFSKEWKHGSLRDMLRYLCGAPNDKTFFTYYMNFWRVKTQPTFEELDEMLKEKGETW